MVKTFFVSLLVFIVAWYLIKALVRLFKLFLIADSSSNNGSKGKHNITLQQTENSKKRFDKDEGDYVDFEEVK